MKYLLSIIALIIGSTLSAQSINVDDAASQLSSLNVLNGVNGEPILNPKYTRIIEGSLYVPANFTKSHIYIRNNKRPISVMSRINVVEERVHFMNVNGVENYATSPIDEIHFFEGDQKTTVYAFGIPGCSVSPKAWFEVLEKGQINLYRMVDKNVQESKTYGSATTDQKIFTTYTYWLQNGSSCSQLKNIAAFQSLLITANPAIKDKLPSRKLSDKKEADWLELARIYNSL
jgi:hypothetical protein